MYTNIKIPVTNATITTQVGMFDNLSKNGSTKVVVLDPLIGNLSVSSTQLMIADGSSEVKTRACWLHCTSVQQLSNISRVL